MEKIIAAYDHAALGLAARRALAYLQTVGNRRVAPSPSAVLDLAQFEEPLPDAPLLLRAPLRPVTVARRAKPGGRPSEWRKASRRGIDIVVPVYRGRAETLECLDALIASPHEGAELHGCQPYWLYSRRASASCVAADAS